MRTIAIEADQDCMSRCWYVAERRVYLGTGYVWYAQCGNMKYGTYAEAYEAYIDTLEYFGNTLSYNNIVIIEDRSFIISQPKSPVDEITSDS